MILSTKKTGKNSVVFLLAGVMSVLLVLASHTAEARGGRGGGGGFSRSSPASGGSITSHPVIRSAAAKRQGGDAGQPRTARNAGDINNPRTTRNAGDIGQPRDAQSAGGVGSAQGAGGVQAGRIPAAPVTAQEMAAYRKQFNEQNKDKDRGDWDNRWRDNDDDNGDEKPVIPAAVVGAVVAAVAQARADDYVGFVNTVGDPGYLTEDACSIEAVTEVNDVAYYRCSDTWYKRGYESGNVVYIPTDPPVGY
ncbi:MAG TPA: hypothetical protein VLB90_04945 [Pseudomonadales bacterium]|nr:hypothetical protein [Pseudomonadales bacterium]